MTTFSGNLGLLWERQTAAGSGVGPAAAARVWEIEGARELEMFWSWRPSQVCLSNPSPSVL